MTVIGTPRVGDKSQYKEGLQRRNFYAAPTIPFNTKLIADGDSLMSFVDGRSIQQWLNVFLDGRFRWTPNPVAGTVATAGDEWLPISNGVAASLALGPQVVLLDGGTNDTNVTVPFQNALDKALQTVTDYNAGGVKVIYMEIPPRADANALVKEPDRKTMTAYMRSLKATKNLMTVDMDLSYSPQYLSRSYDGTHQTSRGAYGEAKKLFKVIDPLLGRGDPRTVLLANKLTNPTLTGVGGTVQSGFVAGSVAPTNFVIDNLTGCTVRASVITDEKGVRKLRFDISGTCTDDTADLKVVQNVAQTITIGENYEYVADVLVAGANGQGDPTGLNAWALTAGNAVAFQASIAANLYGSMDMYVKNTVRACARPVTVGNTSYSTGLYARFKLGPVSARIEFSRPHSALWQ